jgi:two-component system, NtrC family, sensor histidine kinase HydH
MVALSKSTKRNTIVTRRAPELTTFPKDRELWCQPFYAVDGPITSLLHDLRNPLAAICGCAELLMDASLDQAQTRRLASNLNICAKRMKEMLTDFASRSAGAEPAQIYNLRAVIAKACEAAGVTERCDVVLRLDVPLRIALPMARTRMESVFLNLIVNAMEAMPRGGLLRIAAREERDRLVIEIEDSGPGIPAEIGSRLFEPFVTAGKKDGLGLGLALSRRTIEDHGGELRAEAAAGARFVISLPLPLSTTGTRGRSAD